MRCMTQHRGQDGVGIGYFNQEKCAKLKGIVY